MNKLLTKSLATLLALMISLPRRAQLLALALNSLQRPNELCANKKHPGPYDYEYIPGDEVLFSTWSTTPSTMA